MRKPSLLVLDTVPVIMQHIIGYWKGTKKKHPGHSRIQFFMGTMKPQHETVTNETFFAGQYGCKKQHIPPPPIKTLGHKGNGTVFF